MPRLSARPPLAALPFALLPLAAVAFAGCESDDGQVYDAADPANVHDDEHAHAEADHADIGPHGGQVVELTADHSLHGELVMDADDPARGRFYVLGGDLKTPVTAERVALFLDDAETGAETNIEADELSGENTDGAWSFALNLVPGDDEEVSGEVKVVVDGEEYEGTFGHAHHDDHDHAGHDHGDHDHAAHEDHDHDGDGVQDHAPEDHDHEGGADHDDAHDGDHDGLGDEI